MAGVTNDWECAAHGIFEAKVKGGTVPKCPRGCSKGFVKLVHLKAPSFGSARVRTGDKLLREAATLQGLSDISTSPSRPGGSVAQRNAAKNRPSGAQYPPTAAAQAVPLSKFIGALTHKENALTRVGLGHAYEPAEWKKDEKTGAVRHVGAQAPIITSPPASVERVKE
jgi:hypothetical protein